MQQQIHPEKKKIYIYIYHFKIENQLLIHADLIATHHKFV